MTETELTLKEKILAKIKLGGTTFVTLEKIEGFKGDGKIDINLAGHKNLVLWSGVCAEAEKAIQELIAEKEIEMHPIKVIAYEAEGLCLELPIAKKFHDYPKPHWVPVFFKAKRMLKLVGEL